MKRTIYFFLAICFSNTLMAQDGVVFGTKPGNTAHASAEMEVYSTNKGVLIPSMATPAATITSPATGLMVYNTTTNRLNYYDGSGWVELPYFTTIIDTDNDTKVSVERNDNDNDSIYFINKGYVTGSLTAAGFDMFSANTSLWVNGSEKIFATPLQNTSIGLGAGIAITTGNSNTCIGADAGKTQTTSSFNTYLGASSGKTATGSNNTFIGLNAGTVTTGNSNTFIGANSGFSNLGGTKNVAIGYQAGYANTTGSNNVFIGKNAGYDMFASGSTVTGSNNILIGNNTAFASDLSNSVQIGNLISSNSSGNISFNNQYVFPNVSGSNGYTLMLNADNKTLRWADAGINPVDQTVVASAANLYPFDIGTRTGDFLSLQRQVFFVPIVPNVNTTISNIMVWIKTCYTGNLQVAVYNGADNSRMGYSPQTAFTVASGKPDFISATLSSSVSLVKGQTYWIGIRTEGGCNFDFAKNANTLGNIIYLSYYNKPSVFPTCNPSIGGTQSNNKAISTFDNITDLDNVLTQAAALGFGAPNPGLNQCTMTNVALPWVRAY